MDGARGPAVVAGGGATTNAGVEAKECDIADTYLDISGGRSVPPPPRAAGAAPVDDESGSYIQVLVQKHRASATRTPAAASCTAPAGSPLLLAWGLQPARGFLPQDCYPQYGESPLSAAGRDGLVLHKPASRCERKCEKSSWKRFNKLDSGDMDMSDNSPARVELYYFEQGGGEFLAAGDAAPPTAVERGSRRWARLAHGALHEALAAVSLVLSAPVSALVAVERAALVTVREALGGALQTAADHLLKPALALVFNALVHPPLAFAAQTMRAVRRVLRPATLALGDAVEPAARLLGALRLVHVHVERRCECTARERAV